MVVLFDGFGTVNGGFFIIFVGFCGFFTEAVLALDDVGDVSAELAGHPLQHSYLTD